MAEDKAKQEDAREVFEREESKTHLNDYGRKIRAFFQERGLTLLGEGEAFLSRTSQGWTSASRWDSERLQAMADAMRLANMVVAGQKNSQEASSIPMGLAALSLLMVLTPQDLRELDDGAWKEAVDSAAPPTARDRLIWASRPMLATGWDTSFPNNPCASSKSWAPKN